MVIFENTDFKLVVIGDFGKDPDDSFALLNGDKVDEYIATLYPSDMRGRLAKGLLKSLGRTDTPVYIGKNPGIERITVADYEFRFDLSDSDEVVYCAAPIKKILEDGLPVVFVVNAAMTDLYEFFTSCDSSVGNIKAIIMQGGYCFSGNQLVPDTAANNEYDTDAAKACFKIIQSHKIPFYIVTSQLAYDFPLSFTYGSLPKHEVSDYLESVRDEALEDLYKLARYPAGDKRREGFPNDRDTAWFFKNIVKAPMPKILPDTIGHLITTLNVYDVFSVLFTQSPENFTTVSISNLGPVYEVKQLPGFDYQSWILDHSKTMLS
jgi:hypothetical protein